MASLKRSVSLGNLDGPLKAARINIFDGEVESSQESDGAFSTRLASAVRTKTENEDGEGVESQAGTVTTVDGLADDAANDTFADNIVDESQTVQVEAVGEAPSVFDLIKDGQLASYVQGSLGKLSASNLGTLEKQLAEQHAAQANESEDISKLSINDQKRMRALKTALGDGKLDPTSYLMAEFRRLHKKGTPEGDVYATKKQAEAAQYRLQWAEQAYESFKKEKIHQKVWARVDTTKGQYKTLNRIIADDGGFECKAAVEGAITLAQQCTLMGAPWVKFNEQKNQMMFLELDFSYEETFKEAWGEFTKQHTDGKVAAKTAEAAAKGPEHQGEQSNGDNANEKVAAAEGPKPNAKTKAKAKAKQTSERGGTEAGTPSKAAKSDDKDNFLAVWRMGVKHKTEWLQVTSQMNHLKIQIESTKEWGWANNDGNKGEMLRLSKDVDEALSDFQRKFVTEDSNALKKKYSTSITATELKGMESKMPILKSLDVHCQLLVRRHSLS
jgi:hypothetical protein